MEMDRKKKGMLLLTVAGAAAVILLAVFFVWAQSPSGKRKKAEDVNVYVDVPNAEEKPLEDSKIKSYRSGRSNIEDYWDDMGEALEETREEAVDPARTVTGTVTGTRRAGPARTAPRSYTAEDVFGSAPPARSVEETRPQPSRQDAVERRAMYQRERQAALDEVMRRQEEMMRAQQGATGKEEEETPPAPVEEPRDRIDVDRVMVRRSGSVTTLEDGFTSVTSSGVSSLEGTASEQFFVDEAYPFKCMFVRSGKLRSGERVSVRLLEDMVIDGQLVPKNTHLMAVCSIGTRLDLNVSSIDLGGKIINLDYDAYDNDGTKGIYCPGISDKTVSQAAGTAVSGARSRLTSRIGRAAQDVVNTGLSLITLSGGETAVQVPAGYQFYLVKSRRK